MQHFTIAHAHENQRLIMTEEKTPLDFLMEKEEIENDAIELAGISGIPRDALARLLDFILGKSELKRTKWKTSTLRMAALCHLLNIRGMRALSLDELGKELGCTRANMSLYALAIVDELQIDKSFTGKSRESREGYRQAALASHRARNHRMSEDVKPSADSIAVTAGQTATRRRTSPPSKVSQPA